MKRLAFALCLTAMACEPDGLADRTARDKARDVVRPVLANTLPGVPLEPATDCIIENASAVEILRLARSSVTGVKAEDAALIVEIAKRPDSISCLLSSGISPFLLKG